MLLIRSVDLTRAILCCAVLCCAVVRRHYSEVHSLNTSKDNIHEPLDPTRTGLADTRSTYAMHII